MNAKHILRMIPIGLACLVALWNVPLRGQSPGSEEARRRQAVAARRDTSANRGGAGEAAARAPSWVPLSPNQQRYLDQLLDYWEYKSSQIERYRCKFRRWEYDPVFGPKEKFKTYSEGLVKYSAPDKGLFRVEKMSRYQPPKQQGGDPEYVEADEAKLEHWICDGEWVYQMDYQRKRLVQTQLPPRMRGKAIGKGPLPFLFNAKADDIKHRFWIHVITPPDTQGEYWLEAVPRTQEDAGNFKKIHVIISEGDYLPKAMVLFDQSTSSRGNPPRTTFEFVEREVNFNILAEKLNLFHREFYEPAVPSGWEKDVRKWNQSAGGPRQASGASEESDRKTSNR